jgi:hypothetical protein
MNWLLKNTITLTIIGTSHSACTPSTKEALPSLNKKELAFKYFDTDTTWYLQNIPFFECSYKEIETVYYYRWKLYKAHLRHVGTDEYVITEFVNDVHGDRDPYSAINDATTSF